MPAPRRKLDLGLGLLLGAVFVWLTVSVSPRVGMTFDELGHIVSGYSYWKFDDYRVNAENGVFSTRAGALPLLFEPLQFPARDHPHWQDCNARALGYDFFFHLGNDPARMLHRARWAAAGAGLVLLWLIWRWARNLFGLPAGLLAVILAAFSPTILAHSGFATSDMTLTCCLLAALSAWWRLWHRVTIGRILLAGLTAGLAFTTKTSGVLLIPILGLLLLLRGGAGHPLRVALGAWRRRFRTRLAVGGMLVAASAAAALGSVGVIWAGYGFRYASHPPQPGPPLSFEHSWDLLLTSSTRWPPDRTDPEDPATARPSGLTQRVALRVVSWARDHRVLPEAFLWGQLFTYKSSREREAFLMGDYSVRGWPKFFPLAFLLKSTPVELLLFAAGVISLLVVTLRRRTDAHSATATAPRWLYRAAPLLVLFVLYWGVAIATPLNIGHRHLLPVYPVVFVFAGAAAIWLVRRRSAWAGALLALLVVAQVASALGARPFYLSYFTPVVGGQDRGWHYLIDSSFDWGQGLPDFTAWLEERRALGDTTPVYLTYFGSDSPRARQLPVTRFADWRDDHGQRNFPARVGGGWYAISATHFRRVYLQMPGPWNDRFEQLYLAIDRRIRFTPEQAARLTEQDRAQIRPMLQNYELLQFGRLCHFLQHREPARLIGGSILLFKLTAEEVAFALNQPLAAVNARLAQEARATR